MQRIRSLLFVPGDSERKIAKALECPADALILDLEDAVMPDRKPAAREICRAALRVLAARLRGVATCRDRIFYFILTRAARNSWK
jgi:citrate lyase subunit beta/citryl-CoA lyase